MFAGEAQRCRPPDPRDFQVAVIHEGGSGPVLLRLGFLSPSLQLAFPPDVRNVIEVRLHIGVALSGWPSEASSFPARLPLHHPLALLAYKSAQNVSYLSVFSFYSQQKRNKQPLLIVRLGLCFVSRPGKQIFLPLFVRVLRSLQRYASYPVELFLPISRQWLGISFAFPLF